MFNFGKALGKVAGPATPTKKKKLFSFGKMKAADAAMRNKMGAPSGMPSEGNPLIPGNKTRPLSGAFQRAKATDAKNRNLLGK